MTLSYAATQNPAYHLNRDLSEPSYRSNVCRFPVDDAEYENALLEKLGTRGWGRVQYFRNNFDVGWGESGNGKALSPKAHEAFLRFVQAAQFPAGVTPSVFLTDEGGIEVSWEDSQGHPVQVEFRRDGVEYYIGVTQAEDSADYGDIEGIARSVGV
jgi:hypothetical protein